MRINTSTKSFGSSIGVSFQGVAFVLSWVSFFEGDIKERKYRFQKLNLTYQCLNNLEKYDVLFQLFVTSYILKMVSHLNVDLSQTGEPAV